MSTLVFQTDEHSLEMASGLLKRGKLIAFPTETVYGLGAAIFNPLAIADIFRVKNRPQDNPLIAHIRSIDQMRLIAVDIPEIAFLLAARFFPGPLTIVLKKADSVPSIVSNGGGTIALRMPSHPVAKRLIELTGEPIVAPSANLSGSPSSTCAQHVLSDFEGKIAGVIDGGSTEIGIESTVISLIDPDRPMILRPGAITEEQIEAVLKRKLATLDQDSKKPLSPGMKYRHYAPKAQVLVFDSKELLDEHVKSFPTIKRAITIPQAISFYADLRKADVEGCQEICFLCDEKTKAHLGLMNRLNHAARK
jgi:L-threonylcarbamoyladenylate synthase